MQLMANLQHVHLHVQAYLRNAVDKCLFSSLPVLITELNFSKACEFENFPSKLSLNYKVVTLFSHRNYAVVTSKY